MDRAMKMSPAEWGRRKADPLKAGIRAVLLHGPDGGLTAQTRAEALKALLGAATDDPFRRADVSPDALRKSPALLADECAALAFGGGGRVVLLDGAGDGHAAAVSGALAAMAEETFLLMTAGVLASGSKLRKLMEAEKQAAAVALYPAEGAALGDLAAEELRRLGGPDSARETRAVLAAALSGASHGEVLRFAENLALYKLGDSSPLTPEEVMALAPGSAEAGADDLAMAAAEGAADAVPRLLAGFAAQGGGASQALRGVIRHFTRLRAAMAIVERERIPIDAALDKLRPPVFFKIKGAMASQARGWSAAALEQALMGLAEAEAETRRGGRKPEEAIVARAILRAASLRRR